VLAAVSDSPFAVDRFAQNGRWDTRALSTPGVRDDAESGLLELVQGMKPTGQGFEYDVASYVVAEQYARDPYADPYGWGYGSRFGAWYGPRYFYGYPRGWRYW
jgi:hypothetical protein